MRAVRARVEELLPLKNLPPEVLSVTSTVSDPGRLADLVASHLRLRLSESQEVLETRDPLARLSRVDAFLRRELEVTAVQAEIQSQAKEEMSRSQREHILREQLRAIQAELGETDSRTSEVEEYRAKRWDFSRIRAYQICAASDVVADLSTIVNIPLPQNEAQACPLTQLKDPAQRRRRRCAFEQVVRRAQAAGDGIGSE